MKKLFVFLLCAIAAVMPATAESGLPSVAEFTGGSISYEDAYAEYSATLQTYSDFGWGEEAVDHEELATEVLQSMVEEAVLRIKAEELGLTAVPESELEALKNSAHESYEDLISYYIDFLTTEDMSDEEARAVTEEYLAEEGQSEADILASLTDDWWYSAMYDYICGDVVIDENHILEYAESLATTQMLQFAEDPSYFDYLYMNDELIAYYPEGMRYIKHILIGFDADGALAYQQTVGDADIADIDPAVLDEIYAPLEDRVAEVESLLLDGADFDELMRTYGDDDTMLYEPYSVNGYIVREDSQLFVNEFVDACFALENAGDISDPIRTAGGVHFILYVGDVPSGQVALENIVDSIAAEAQDQLISDTFDAQVAEWVEEAQPVYHPEYLLQ